MKKKRVFDRPLTERSLVRWILWPIDWMYGMIMEVRNHVYDRQILKSYPSPQFSIVVGNLTVGGTGKTPMVEYLIRDLSKKNQVATLSRGYGRLSRGFVLAKSDSTAEEIGDEPLQYYEKYGEEIIVAVCENRVTGCETLHNLFPKHQLLLLDDAFQHRALRADRYLLLNDYNRPFYRDSPFPGGRLRENRRGAVRADAIITTKCPPDLSNQQRAEITNEILCYAHPHTPCFFSRVGYGTLRNFENTVVGVHTVTLVAGIAQPEAFVRRVREHFDLQGVYLFPDHHAYTESEVENLLKKAKNSELIITTEKDMVKLRPLVRKAGVLSRFGYIPIEVDFGSDTGAFRRWLAREVEKPLGERLAIL